MHLCQWQISVKADKYIKLFLIRSDSKEGGIACFVLVLVPAILAEEALFVKLEVLRAALLSHLLRLLEVEGNIAVRWTRRVQASTEHLLLHLLSENLALLRLVTVCVGDVKTGLDFACLLLVSGLAECAAEDVLRFDLGDVALIAWHAELVLSVGFLLAHRHLLHHGGFPLLGDLRRLVASVTG